MGRYLRKDQLTWEGGCIMGGEEKDDWGAARLGGMVGKEGHMEQEWGRTLNGGFGWRNPDP